MILGIHQCRSPAGDLPAGLALIETALKGAASAGVDMLVMPELLLPGYNADLATPPEDWEQAVPRVRSLCRSHGVALTLGLPEYAQETTYNAALAISEAGEILARYRKIQLFGPRESALFSPGDSLVTFDYRGTRFGLLICYDVEFPEHVRALARAGARVILVPTANMCPFVNVNHILVPARAAENALTIAYANYCGTEGDLTYTGMSLICGPEGYPLAAKGQDEGLVIAELPSGDWREHDIPLSTQSADYRPASAP